MTADDSDIPVTAEAPDSAFSVTGTDHITVIGSNEEDTVEFYRDVLGMPLVLRQPNLDAPDVTHLFFDTGDGRILTFFVEESRDSSQAPQRTPLGGVHHLAFSIEASELQNIKEALQERNHGFNEFDRGAFHSLYTRDHNGLTIELVVDKYAIPDDRRGEVLALAHGKRVEAGDDYVDDPHMEAAIEELGLDVERADIPDAATGTGYDD
ncbi:VOC family protein [Halobaculum sp. D14]|uniref:VOC family protein n=1 Tax=unclassified Halobaculum TaxID=2640896 RepID=UPI003EB8CF1B